MSEDYSALTLARLNEIVKEKGLKLHSGMKKAEIVAALEEAEKKAAKSTKPAKEKAAPKQAGTESDKKEKEKHSGRPAKKAAGTDAPVRDTTAKDAAVKEKPARGKAAAAKKDAAEKPAVTKDAAEKQAVTEKAAEKPADASKKPQKKAVKEKKTTEPEQRTEGKKSDEQRPAVASETRDRGTEREQSRSYDKNRQQAQNGQQGQGQDRPQPQQQNQERPQPQQQNQERPQPQQQGQERSQPQQQGQERPQSQQQNQERQQPQQQGQERPQPQQQNQASAAANIKEGILEIMPDGFGFIRCDNFLPGPDDVYVSPTQIRRMNLKTGDIINGIVKDKTGTEKFNALLYVNSVNGFGVGEAIHRKRFEDLTPVFPYERINLETPGCPVAMRMVNLLSPIGKGQRGMIVSQPKAGKTTLLKQAAKAIKANHPEIHIIVLLIDERPEEVTDMKESIEGENVEVIYSTFDELPENHKRVSEMVIERAKRLVEHQKDVIILLDSITRLARAYNLTCMSSGRTLSGGLDPAALYMPKRFFGAARKMREGGSLTILATALVETGSRMDDVVFEEFKGTGNMELVLDRNLSERRIFPAIDLPKSSTRREDLLLTPAEMEANYLMRKALNGARSDDAIERIIQLFAQTKTNQDFVDYIRKYGVFRVQAT
jgi:transcription termination factor Rho